LFYVERSNQGKVVFVGFKHKKLSNEKRNTLRCKYRHVRLLIIDECSMVGNEMFNFINLRLQEIIPCNMVLSLLSVVCLYLLLYAHLYGDDSEVEHTGSHLSVS
jgi:hypothetical protein